MSKAAILTIFRVSNYGSVLQAYASQCLMERMGYDCVMIDYRYPNDWHYGKGAVRVYESPVKKLVKWVAGHFAAFPPIAPCDKRFCAKPVASDSAL